MLFNGNIYFKHTCMACLNDNKKECGSRSKDIFFCAIPLVMRVGASANIEVATDMIARPSISA